MNVWQAIGLFYLVALIGPPVGRFLWRRFGPQEPIVAPLDPCMGEACPNYQAAAEAARGIEALPPRVGDELRVGGQHLLVTSTTLMDRRTVMVHGNVVGVDGRQFGGPIQYGHDIVNIDLDREAMRADLYELMKGADPCDDD